MKNKKLFYGSLAVVGLVAVVYALPSFWAFYLWAGFPETSIERADFIRSTYGVGRDCGGPVLGQTRPDRGEILACFSNSVLDRSRVYEEDGRGSGELELVYRCDGDGFSGENVYIFYPTSELYVCRYKIADRWEDIPHYQTGDIAGFPQKVSPLTRLLIRVFR